MTDGQLRVVGPIRMDEEVCEAALAAVDHLLGRAQTDPDVGYLIGPGTTSFSMLCRVQALAQGRGLDLVMRERAIDLQPPFGRRRAEVVELKERIAELERKLSR